MCAYTCHQNLKISLKFALLPCQLKPGYVNFCVLMFHTLQECHTSTLVTLTHCHTNNHIHTNTLTHCHTNSHIHTNKLHIIMRFMGEWVCLSEVKPTKFNKVFLSFSVNYLPKVTAISSTLTSLSTFIQLPKIIKQDQINLLLKL